MKHATITMRFSDVPNVSDFYLGRKRYTKIPAHSHCHVRRNAVRYDRGQIESVFVPEETIVRVKP